MCDRDPTEPEENYWNLYEVLYGEPFESFSERLDRYYKFRLALLEKTEPLCDGEKHELVKQSYFELLDYDYALDRQSAAREMYKRLGLVRTVKEDDDVSTFLL